MKNLITLIFCILSIQSFAQFFIGIPMLDRNRKVGKCLVCQPKDSNVVRYLDEVYNLIDEKLEKFDYSREIYLKQISFLDSLLQNETYSDEIKVNLIYTKIHCYLKGVIEEGNVIYNYSCSTVDSITDFSGATKIVSLFDEILSMNMDSVSKKFFQNVKLMYYTQSFLIYDMNNKDIDWVKNEQLLNQFPKDEKNLAQNFLDTKKTTKYNPFFTYDAYGLGISSSIGKEQWLGFEFSYDPVMETANPFKRYNPLLGYRMDTRISWISWTMLFNKNKDKIDFLFSICDVKNYNGFKVNLVQFGLHSSTQFNSKLFYRPEIGYTFGIFTLSYSYNFTFDKAIRSSTEKNMLNFSISYPLIRLGKYY